MSAFSAPQLDGLALGFLNLRDGASNIVQIFWGLWLFPFGMLVIKSGFFPKILGRGLIVACFAYLVASAAFILSLSHKIYHPAQYLGGIAEEAMILWLIVKGAKVPAPQRVSIQG